MRLTEFSYNDKGNWTLLSIKLNQSNLLVGENSAGKSRTIEAIKMCADFIAQNNVSHSFFNPAGTYYCDMTFEDDGKSLVYLFRLNNSVVERESLYVVDKEQTTVLIDRKKELCLVNGVAMNPPADKLLIHVRRDKDEYPLFEKIILWAQYTYFLPFSKLKDAEFNDMRFSNISLAKYVDNFTDEQKKSIKARAKALNYNIGDFYTQTVGELKVIIFSEVGVATSYMFINMSNGMFRTLYVLMVLEYLASHAAPSLMLIDDFSEGLDYGRSVALGKLVFEYCADHNIELVVSSNDSFLMDVVPTDNWIILNREGSTVSNICKATHPDLFGDFSFTGLNNFSLFSSDFIARYQSKHKDEQA